MAELRCPKCGKSNPDVLDVCQFCQTPLKKGDSVLRIGETPTRKDTGELESVLPDWLKNVRQQARTSAEENAAQASSQSESPKEEQPDFLAGLASQTSSAGDDEIPDWLASMNPAAAPKSSVPPFIPESAPEPESDFFAQFNQTPAKPAGETVQSKPTALEPAVPSQPETANEDDLSKWFAQATQQPDEIVEVSPDSHTQGQAPWTRDLETPQPPPQEAAPQVKEDLSWLHDLEDSAKQTGDLQAPKSGTDWAATFETPASASEPAGLQEDLSWLNSLGSVEAAAQPSEGDDLSWLNNLDAIAKPHADAAPAQPAAAPPFAPGEDLSWLNELGGAQEPSQPAEAAASASSQEDLSWLNNLGGAPSQPAQAVPASSGEDLSWLNDLGGGVQPTPPFTEPVTPGTPGQTPPVGKPEEMEPDWLRSALETPSGPASSSDASMDWFSSQGQPVEEKPASPGAPAPSPFSDVFSTPSEPASLPGQDVDSLFSVEMPDWLSHAEQPVQPVAGMSAPEEVAAPAAGGEESLAPVDLPSWVQAMRPVEAVISETTSSAEEQPEEKEGPLAGLRGVIPGAALGLSRRPKAVSLKLQATDEQQASAALLEKILGSETNPRALVFSSFVASQQALRWILTGLFLVVLGAVIFLRSQSMPISASLPPMADQVSRAVESVPSGAKVLVVIDYEPSLAGEMEAVGGPLLDQLIVQRNPQLSFVATSLNGSALVERLMVNTHLNELKVQYRNLGFLPGGSTGVLGFIENPGEIIPAAEVGKFSDYAMLVLMTDHAESGRVWVEQLSAQRQIDSALAGRPLVAVASAQAGPLLQPYWSSGQIMGLVSGLSEAARYEYKNGSRPGTVRSYWDAFGAGLMMAVILIVVGSLWSLISGIRARRAEAEQG